MTRRQTLVDFWENRQHSFKLFLQIFVLILTFRILAFPILTDMLYLCLDVSKIIIEEILRLGQLDLPMSFEL